MMETSFTHRQMYQDAAGYAFDGGIAGPGCTRCVRILDLHPPGRVSRAGVFSPETGYREYLIIDEVEVSWCI
jgi:hypothetical protein